MTNWAIGLQMYEILVPASSQKKKFSLAHHQAWDSFVKNISGGLTITRTAKGEWMDRQTGTIHKDRMIPVRIVCNRKQIKKIMNFTLSHYDQIEVIAYPISQEVLIVRKSN